MGDLIFFTLLQVVVTWMMVGVITFTQIVHYPLYLKIKEGFVEYERSHIRRAAFLIGPIMLIEAIGSLILIGIATEGLLSKLATINLILLIFIWLSTLLFQVTQHQKLSVRFSRKIFNSLMASNWIRTILWTLKGCVMIVMTYFLLK